MFLMIYLMVRLDAFLSPDIIFFLFWIQEKGPENSYQGLKVGQYDIILYKCVREPKWGAEGFGTDWGSLYMLAQIFGDLAWSQRPLLFTPVNCSLAGVHQMLQAACPLPLHVP